MLIYCITGNEDKFNEIAALIDGPLEQLSIDVPEIQELDPKAVIKHKLMAARTKASAELLVEDTSLTLECLGGKLPGPLVKWFEKGIGNDGIVEITKKLGSNRATAISMVGYLDAKGVAHFFSGKMDGTIVPARGDNDFGWDPIFMPDGYTKTLGEMGQEEKNAISMRADALKKLNAFLKK